MDEVFPRFGLYLWDGTAWRLTHALHSFSYEEFERVVGCLLVHYVHSEELQKLTGDRYVGAYRDSRGRLWLKQMIMPEHILRAAAEAAGE